MPLLWLGLAIIAGNFVSAQIQGGWGFWAALFFSGLLLSGIEYSFSRKYFHPLLSKKLFSIPAGLLIALFALGGWRFQSILPDPTPNDLSYYQSVENALLIATISSFPELSQQSSVAILDAETLSIQGQEKPVSGKLELRLPGGFHLAYGDRLALEGSIKPVLSKGEPVHVSYLARRGILSRMAYPQITTLSRGFGNPLVALLYSAKENAYEFITSQMPIQESSLLSGILLGIDQEIPGYLESAYRTTGTMHIIAISGFNIALIAGLVIRFFRRIFKPALAGILAVSAILFYTLMVGAEPSVVRAAIMGSLAIPAYYIGRRIIGVNTLIVAAAVMLLLNPMLLWDLGFQLSFLATLGLMVLADPLLKLLQNWMGGRFSEKTNQTAMPFGMLLISTLCAQFAVSPVVLGLSPDLLPYSLAANLIILPLQPPLMVVGGIAVLAHFIFPPVGAIMARFAWALAAFCNQVVLHFAKLPFAEVRLPEASAWLAFGLVLVVLILSTLRTIREVEKPSIPAIK